MEVGPPPEVITGLCVIHLADFIFSKIWLSLPSTPSPSFGCDHDLNQRQAALGKKKVKGYIFFLPQTHAGFMKPASEANFRSYKR